jgi:redox-sensitive bicupin YhaK (pirin superfamily)
VTLASGFAEDVGALPIRTDARVVGATLRAGDTADYTLGVTRRGYMVPARGSIEVNGVMLHARDGAAIANENILHIRALDDAEIVLVDSAV